MTALNEMTGAELLAHYNELSPTKRRAKFDSKEEAVRRIRALEPKAADKPKPVEAKAPEKPPAPPKKPKEEPSLGESKHKVKDGTQVLRVMADQNPRREGTEAHRHFEAMKGSITVEQYLEKFAEGDRRTARQWLYNTVKDGHVKLVGG
jgi:hypothetical protein